MTGPSRSVEIPKLVRGGHELETIWEIPDKLNHVNFELVATNRVDGKCNATPAVAGGAIFIRTMKNIYCIGEQK